MNIPIISIVLPTFNGSKYLEEAITSCLQQTFVDWELIIVDDASTDGTPGIIQRFISKDDRIRSIRHERNRKLPAALNTGFSAARGSCFTWTSDDNRYKPDALSKMLAHLEKNPDIAIVYSDYECIYSEGKRKNESSAPEPSYLVSGNIVGPSFLYRRNVQDRIGGYDETVFLAEDYDYWLRASTLFKLSPVHENLYQYRLHKRSLTELYDDAVDIPYRIALHRSLPNMRWLSPRMSSIGWLNLSAFAWKARDWTDFARCTGKAVFLSPLVVCLVTLKVILLRRNINRRNMLWLPRWL